MTGTFITAEEVAEMLCISRGAVYDLAAPKGPIPCVRLGRRLIRFKVADVLAHIVACTHSQAAPRINLKMSTRPVVKLQVSNPLNCFERLGIKVKPKLKSKPKS
ncbi:helix-turn-helix transcriptional regulator [Massilia sp. DWR3-1-1]|uniref:helix-turn-helix transcriptional regulator n=1 Tax=Massilia sp. DWR3-1-1 TaxID=2804559 RepID=UPI003CE70A6F